MADIAVITGASSGLGVKFLEAVVNRYPQMDEYWILARRKERLDKLVGIVGQLSRQKSGPFLMNQ